MKRITASVLAVVMVMVLAFGMTGGVYAQDDIKITIDGTQQSFDQMPVMVNDRVLVPMRGIFEALGAEVSWDDATQTASGVKDGKTVSLAIGSTNATVNGAAVTLDVPAQLVNDRTMVPVRFISESLGAQVDWDDASQTVIIESAADVLRSFVFDDLTAFESEKDFQIGGDYDAKNISLSSEQDHTTGTGKSAKLANRTATSCRLKLMNMLDEENLNKTYTLTAWVYIPDMATSMRVGTYGTKGTATATAAAAHESFAIPQAEWTKITFTFDHTNVEADMIGFDQDPTHTLTPTMYIDDVELTLGGESAPQLIESWEGPRPVPTEFSRSNDPYDLIYYDEPEDPEAMIASLPEGDVVLNNDSLLNGAIMGSEYGTIEQVDVDGPGFTKALHVTVNDPLPEYPYNFQVRMDMPDIKFNVGDLILVKLSMRTLSGGIPESRLGQVECIVEELTSGSHNKAVIGDIQSSNEWVTGYFPFVVKDGYADNLQATVRLAYYVQEVEIGGYEMINYGKDVTLDQMPDTSNYPGQEHDAAWRKEAIDRIEQIRKGDVKVVVQDAAGNPVSGAKVDVNMTEHAFQWGSAVNGNMFKTDSNGLQYQQAIRENFNSAVLENEHKWIALETDPQKTQRMVDWLHANGIRDVRGHTLVWESYKSDFAVPQDLRDMVAAGDREGYEARVKGHIQKTLTDWKGQLSDWDLINEMVANNNFKDAFGIDTVVDWCNWAEEADPDVPKYISETGIVGVNGLESPSLKGFVEILDYLKEKNAPYDGIAIHGHFGALCHPYNFYEQIDFLAERYDKPIKITEFDVRSDPPETTAEFIRDIIILCFSNEHVDGFHMWGFWDGSHWFSNAPLYAKDWTLKPSGEQYQDLVYNKWWTRESGQTGADGSYALRAFYGDYEIKVDANGQVKTVQAKVEKGADNTIVVTLD